MRIRYILGIIIVVVLTTHFATGSLIEPLDQPQMRTTVIHQEAPPSSAIHGTLDPARKIEKEKSIFSMSTLTVLFAAVLGIVAFRKNRNS